jgi:hypothetical protein
MIIDLGDTIKILGFPFTLPPAVFGMYKQVSSKEVIPLDLYPGSYEFEITKPGDYVVYLNWLRTLWVWRENPNEDIVIRFSAGDVLHKKQYLSVTEIDRIVRPFDSLVATGKPILSVHFDEPGIYTMYNNGIDTRVALLPDYISGHERELTVWMGIELALLIAVIFIVLVMRGTIRFIHHQELKIKQSDRFKRGNDFWKQESERRKSEQEKEKTQT